MFRANESIRWRAAAYRGFRAPTPAELYRTSTVRGGVVIAPNPDLEPEHLIGVESGMNFTRGKYGGQVTLFWNEIEDAVAFVDLADAGPVDEVIEPCGLVEAGGICRAWRNIGETRALGAEVDFVYRPAPAWDLSVSYLYSDQEFTDAPEDPELEGNTPRHAPEDAYTLRVEYSDPRILTASLQGRYIGDRFDDNNNELPVDSFFVVDMTLSKGITDQFELFAAVENLFDEEYEIRVSSRGLVEIGRPRWIYGGVRLAF